MRHTTVSIRSRLRVRLALVLVILLATELTAGGTARAQDNRNDTDWVGRKVVLRERVPLRLGDGSLLDESLYPVFTVEKTEGDRFFIAFQGIRLRVRFE
jgi:hypothetical protein